MLGSTWGLLTAGKGVVRQIQLFLKEWARAGLGRILWATSSLYSSRRCIYPVFFPFLILGQQPTAYSFCFFYFSLFFPHFWIKALHRFAGKKCLTMCSTVKVLKILANNDVRHLQRRQGNPDEEAPKLHSRISCLL